MVKYQKSIILELVVCLLLVMVAGLMWGTYQFAPELVYSELVLIMLGLLAPLLVSDMLLNWLFLFSIALAIIVMMAGIVYLPIWQCLLLSVTFPIVAIIEYIIVRLGRTRRSAVQNEQKAAKALYEEYIDNIRHSSDHALYPVLIHWAHYDHFKHINPTEYHKALKRILLTLENLKNNDDSVFYVSNGNFLILSPELLDDEQMETEPILLSRLSDLHFMNRYSVNAIQFKQVYQRVDQNNIEKYARFDELMKSLERQLETQLVVEY